MAVYTEVGDEALTAFVAEYELGQMLSCKGIAEGVENSNFLVRAERGEFILTIYEKRVKPADLPFFLGLLLHLAQRGIPCPLPLTGRDGAALRQLMRKPAAMFTFLDGVSLRRPGPQHVAEVGRALARLHLAGADFALRRPNDLSVDGWRRLLADTLARADEVRPGLAAELSAEFDGLAARWPRELPVGVIHADLFPDNVFFLGDRLSGLIDFYFACNDWLAYDLAVCLNAWCFEREGEFNITKARRLVAGYVEVRPLTAQEIAQMPILARGAALRFLLTRLYDWLNQVDGALVKPKDPLEYLTRLRFHRRAGGPGAYGIG
ncbi:MAG: homoserine kinase [Alphaproteobacteria bacterium]|nr:homoserine kinase [Alphaproteobacteria bacterium]